MKKLKIGFAGVGAMGQCAHLKNYALLTEECEVVALAELREEQGRRVAARYGVPRVYRTAEEMLAKEQLDGLVAAQLFYRHGSLLPTLLRPGLPVFIEKPLAWSIEQGEKIIAALDKAGTKMMVGYHKRSDPATMVVKAEIERLKQTGELGALKYVRIAMPIGDWVVGGFNDWINSDDPAIELPNDPPAAGMDESTFKQYVAFVNFYIHQVNLLRHLLGEPYQVKYADPTGVMLAVRSASGVPGVIEMNAYRTTVDWQESALVAFEKGYIKLEIPPPMAQYRAGRIEMLRDPGEGATPQVIVPQVPSVHAMRQQAINFLKVVRGEMAPPCEAHEALEDLKVAREYVGLLRD